MAANALVDSSFLAALLIRRDSHHKWAAAQAAQWVPPWRTCEAALTEAFYLVRPPHVGRLAALLRRGVVIVGFELSRDQERVLALMEKYADVPMSLADACLVCMTEIIADSVVLTTDSDFRIYRRHNRQIVPCAIPH